MNFWTWFDEKRGNLSVREVERRGNAPRGRISNVYRKKEPSALVCETISEALGFPVEEVFRQAGLLTRPDDRGYPSTDQMIREIWERIAAPEIAQPGSGDIPGPSAQRVLELMNLLPAYWQEKILADALQRLAEYSGELDRLKDIAGKVSFEERKNALLDLIDHQDSEEKPTESDSR